MSRHYVLLVADVDVADARVELSLWRCMDTGYHRKMLLMRVLLRPSAAAPPHTAAVTL